MEVAMARVYNWDVAQKRKERGQVKDDKDAEAEAGGGGDGEERSGKSLEDGVEDEGEEGTE